MLKHTKTSILEVLKIDFIRFCIVGGTGFLINLLLLNYFHIMLNLPIVISQLISAEVALFSNFMLHHHWTYRSNMVNKSMWKLIVQFHVTSWPAIIGSSIMVGIAVNTFHLSTIQALIISSGIALLWNFFWSKYVIWKGTSKEDIERMAE